MTLDVYRGRKTTMQKKNAPEGHLVGTEETWYGWVDSVTGPRNVFQCQESCLCCHYAWSLVMWVHLWSPMGGPLCWWPCYHSWIVGEKCQKALDLERSNRGERAESKCRKEKDHDLWYETGSPVEFRQVPMRCLSYWSGQQQHLPRHWVHKKCSGLKRLTEDPDYRCTQCQGTARPLEGSSNRPWQAGGGTCSFLLLPGRHAQ